MEAMSACGERRHVRELLSVAQECGITRVRARIEFMVSTAACTDGRPAVGAFGLDTRALWQSEIDERHRLDRQGSSTRNLGLLPS